MTPEFRLLWQEIGGTGPLYPRATIMVPVRPDMSLVLVNNAGKQSVDHEGDITVAEIGRDKAGTALSNYLRRYFPAGSNAKRGKVEQFLMSAIWDALSHDGKLVSVSGNVPGYAKLKVGKVEQKLVAAKVRQIYVAFRFLRNLDAKKTMVPATSRDPDEVPDWAADLNWIFGAQANVWFDSWNAALVEVAEQLGQPLSEKQFKDHVRPKSDASADITVFLVGKWARAEGSEFPGDNVVALSDHPMTPRLKANPPPHKVIGDQYENVEAFTLVLAHELAHFGIKLLGHYDTPNVLLSNGIQLTVIHPELQGLLNAPGRKP